MARSPIPQLVEDFHQMTPEEQRCFLDLVDPQPEPQMEKAAMKKKRTRTGSKSPRASNMAATLNKSLQSQKRVTTPMCVACGNDPDHPDHGTGEGQHEFSTDIGTRIVEQLKGHEARCAFTTDGKTCLGAEDDAIHDKSMGYGGYHEFVAPGAQAASVGD